MQSAVDYRTTLLLIYKANMTDSKPPVSSTPKRDNTTQNCLSNSSRQIKLVSIFKFHHVIDQDGTAKGVICRNFLFKKSS